MASRTDSLTGVDPAPRRATGSITDGPLLTLAAAGTALVVAGIAMVVPDRSAAPLPTAMPELVEFGLGEGSARSAASPDGTSPNSPATTPPPAPGDGDVTAAPTDDRSVVPVHLEIPDIDVAAPMIPLGLDGDGALEVPSEPDATGWYTGRATPGDPGPTVIVGHVDSVVGPAVFHQLRHLEIGDLVEIDRSDGIIASYRVVEIVHVAKSAFPTEDVYGPTREPTLRLVTCTGAFDRATRSYVENVIVYGEHMGNRPAVEAVTA